MSSSVYSAFPEEQELLLQDGVSCRVTDVSQKQVDYNGQSQTLTFVSITYPIQKETKAKAKGQDAKLKNKIKKQNRMFQTMLQQETEQTESRFSLRDNNIPSMDMGNVTSNTRQVHNKQP